MVALLPPSQYPASMSSLSAHLRHAHLVLDDAPTRAGVTPLRLVVDDEGDSLDDAERERLEAVIEASTAEIARGAYHSPEEALGLPG